MDCHNIKVYVQEGISLGEISLSPSQRDVAITGQRGLLILDLLNPLHEPRHVDGMVPSLFWPQIKKRLRWNLRNENLIASTETNNVFVWNLSHSIPIERTERRNSTGERTKRRLFSPVDRILHNHQRTVTDVDWSLDPRILASCSLDSMIIIWDLRKEGFAHRFSNFKSVHHLKFNPLNLNEMVSAHENQVNLWDLRKDCFESYSHEFFVSGLDFHPQKRQFVSASLHQICHYDEKKTFETVDFEINYIKYSPLGDKIACCTNEKVLILNHKSYQTKACCLAWKQCIEHPMEHQLICWGEKLEILSGHDCLDKNDKTFHNMAEWALSRTLSFPHLIRPSSAHALLLQNIRNEAKTKSVLVLTNLKQEFIWVTSRYVDIQFDLIDAASRKCCFTVLNISCSMEFPIQYPRETPLIKCNSDFIKQKLQSICQRNISRERVCLEACIRFLLGLKKHEDLDSEEESDLESARFVRNFDSCVMFPRLGSVCWSGDKLCYFFSPFHTSSPRSLDQFTLFKQSHRKEESDDELVESSRNLFIGHLLRNQDKPDRMFGQLVYCSKFESNFEKKCLDCDPKLWCSKLNFDFIHIMCLEQQKFLRAEKQVYKLIQKMIFQNSNTQDKSLMALILQSFSTLFCRVETNYYDQVCRRNLNLHRVLLDKMQKKPQQNMNIKLEKKKCCFCNLKLKGLCFFCPGCGQGGHLRCNLLECLCPIL